MAKIVKRKRRKLNLRGVSVLLFSFALICWLISTLLINTLNTSLTMKIQKMTEELETLKSNNQNLNYEIQSLVNKDRVYAIAQTANLDQVTENIISVNGD